MSEAGRGALRAEVEAMLTSPGAPFETAREPVLGVEMEVFRQRPRSLLEILDRSREHGARPALVVGDERLDFAEHHARVMALACALRDVHGIVPGDRVAILAENRLEWILCFWACLRAGAVVVAMNGWWVEDEIRHALAECAPAMLVADARRIARLPRDAGVPVLDMDAVGELVERHRGREPAPVEIGEDDPAVLLFTSGTTGRPKAAVHSHRAAVATVMTQLFHGYRVHLERSRAGELPADEPCQLVSSPLFHVSGLYAGVVANLAGGVKAVWARGRFDPARVLELVERERVTGWSPHGSMAPRVFAHPDVERRDLSSLAVIGTGGAPFPASLQERIRGVLPQARAALAVGYGLTEAGALVSLEWGEGLAEHPTSVGRPLPTVEVEIRDPEGRTLAEGEEGEIHVRGPALMLGYWRRPDDSARVLSTDRWLATGDIGRIEEGRLHMGARRDDLILRAAENVYPAEVEDRLLGHPAVAEAAVVGLPHPELGQEVKAILVPAEGARIDLEALRTWLADRLAYYKVPTRFEIRADPLPRNAAGKVLRRELVTPQIESSEGSHQG